MQSSREVLQERAFEGAQWVMATDAARAVAQTGARLAQGGGPLAEMIRQRQEFEDALDAMRAAPPATDFATRQRLQREAAALDAELRVMDRRIRSEFPRYAEFAHPRPLGFDGLRRHLAPHEALLLVLSTPEHSHVWAVSPTRVAWHRADIPARDLARRVERLRRDLDPTAIVRAATPLSAPSPTPQGGSFDHALAHGIYRDLLAPVAPALREARHLLVVKDGALSSLPLALLQTEPWEGEVAGAPWLLRRFALTTLPAVSSIASIRTAKARAGAGEARFFGIGDPLFSGASAPLGQEATRAIGAFFDDEGSVIEAIRRLPPLPGTARELSAIADLFPEGHARVLLGRAATETAVKTAALEEVAILSFATHGLVTGDLSGLAEPALALTPPEQVTEGDDGLLTASEAAQLRLNADWVILSACNTAAGDGTPGAEGLSGLARAFLFAGTRSILVSHWPVRDDVAARLTSRTLEQLRDRPALGRSEALRRAMLDLMDDPSDRSLAHPAAWAPFVVVGEGGAITR